MNLYTNFLFTTALCFLSQTGCPQQNKQQIIVEYSYSYLRDVSLSTKLHIKGGESIHFYADRNPGKGEVKQDGLDFKVDIPVPMNDIFFYKNFDEGIIISKEYIMIDSFVVRDSIKQIAWQIYDEQKIIGNAYPCQKAVGAFRGRTYTAWFTEEIPVSNGPWKLGGLPGLILEAYDEKKEVKFEFISLKKSDEKIDFDKVLNEIDIDKVLDWKAYAQLAKKKMKQLSQMFTSFAPENVTVEINEMDINLLEKSILENDN